MSEVENEVEVVRAGPLTTFQDRGRPGLAHLGVPPSGAADLPAFELGNRIVGNDPDAAALEATLVGPTLRFAQAALVALTGADAGATIAGRPLALGTTAEVPAGALLELGACRDGVRAYIFVRGGFAVEATLGSRSHDLLTGLGPPPLRDGDRLPLGPDARAAAATVGERHRSAARRPDPVRPPWTARRLVPARGARRAHGGDVAGRRRLQPHRNPTRRPAPRTARPRRAALRGPRHRCDPGDVRRTADRPRPGPSDHRRLPGDRGGARSRHGSRRSARARGEGSLSPRPARRA